MENKIAKIANVTNGIHNLIPTLRALNLMDKYKDDVIESDQEAINSFNDKFNFLVGQVVELELYGAGTIPAIVVKVHEKDMNNHFSYDILFLIGNRNISFIENKERYLWRFVPKKFNVKRIKRFIDEINDPEGKFNEFRNDLKEIYGIENFYSIENNKILVAKLNPLNDMKLEKSK